MSSYTELMENLKKDICRIDKEYDAVTVKALAEIVNSYGLSEKEISEEILKDPKITKNFLILGTTCGIYMGYTYECAERKGGSMCHWDARNRASEQYCYQHLEELKRSFEKFSGFPMPFKENPDYEDFFHDTWLGRKEKNGIVLKAELKQFQTTHPTLQQSMMQLFLLVFKESKQVSWVTTAVRFPLV